ncbi:SEL1-like repeat protein [Pseudomonas sp. 8O]|uniref:SEL1-like repeat protein n=1 Tax=Pseudomonas sp. 8O TaxID=2653165 RepID=UPI0012F07072|nr:SEL1-like repeat protein [Pseudomonas sp. 8O]VXC68242.1 Sel1 repeat family protein [Pseudomonas sp. 8O]
MRHFHCLPVVFSALMLGCASTPEQHDTTADLNATLPKLTLKTVLPPAQANSYCTAQMDSDILYGLGMQLFNANDTANAKSCLIFAAPEHNRAFCYLSLIADRDQEKSQAEKDQESFNYIAYAASQNDWCAEYGMWRIYQIGSKGVERDPERAKRWLERSALHGYGESQSALAYRYEADEDLASSLAWSRIVGDDHAEQQEQLRQKMDAKQLDSSDKLYESLQKRVISKETMYAEAREEDIGRYSATIHLNDPEVLQGMETEHRRDFIRQAMFTALELPYVETREQVTLYMVLSRRAQMLEPGADILQNPQLVALLQDTELSFEQANADARRIIESTYR